MPPIPLTLLQDFMRGFYGYGSFAAPYWFIGIEEGGGNEQPEICTRLEKWHDRGRKPLEDLVDYHSAIGKGDVIASISNQPTWRELGQMLSAVMGKQDGSGNNTSEANKHLGTSNGNACLLELLPLPSPGSKHWNYLGFTCDSQMPSWLKSRKKCADHCGTRRAEHIREKLVQHRPALVVFYGRVNGKRFKRLRRQIADVELQRDEPCRVDGTCFVLLPHPANRWNRLPPDYFSLWGRKLADKILMDETDPT